MAPISKHIEALEECDLISNLKIPNFELIRLAVKEERLLQGISLVTVFQGVQGVHLLEVFTFGGFTVYMLVCPDLFDELGRFRKLIFWYIGPKSPPPSNKLRFPVEFFTPRQVMT